MSDNIDFVLPWVDPTDKGWQEIRNKYAKGIDTKYANSHARFRDMETLKYTLRSIEENCPWYHKIYLITEGHYPDWLDIENEKIVLVTHEELFIDPSHLPTFNSVAIEMNLHNLKELSETFVYLNDDCMFWNKLGPTRFFVHNKPVDFISHQPIPRNKLFDLFRKRGTWVHSINNVLQLLNKNFAPFHFKKYTLYHESYTFSDKINNFLLQHIFKKLIWLNHWHQPQPLLKKNLQNTYTFFSKEMKISSQNRFRSNNDLNQYIYRYWQLIHGDFYPKKHNDDLLVNINSLASLERIIKILETDESINFICFNDSEELSNIEFENVKIRLSQYLKSHFPNKASFEK